MSWLNERLDALTDAWRKEIDHRDLGQGAGFAEVLDSFIPLLVSILPVLIGPLREQVEHLWIRAAELYGVAGARRGLAAGEVIEEFQILREVVIRDLYRDPPMGGRVPLALREVLRLNRAIDRGVTHASVGHTDALFFELLDDGERGERPSLAGYVEEVREQLGHVRDELRQTTGKISRPKGR